VAAKSFGQWVSPKIAGMARSYIINQLHPPPKLSPQIQAVAVSSPACFGCFEVFALASPASEFSVSATIEERKRGLLEVARGRLR